MTHKPYWAKLARCRECGAVAADTSEYCDDCAPELKECNCCGRKRPNVTQCWTTCGLETWACEECTS